MNQDELKDIKSDRSLSTRKIISSSQVPPRTIVFYSILAVIFLGTFFWVYSGVSSQQENIIKMNNRLISLEENIQSSADLSEETIETLLQDIKLINREIRKLWDLSNKKNKKNISSLTETINVSTKDIKDLKVISKKANESLIKFNESLKSIKKRMAKLSSFELNSATYKNRLDELEEAIKSIDAYRIQVNQSLIEIRDELNSKPVLIENQ
jgi:chromosome segregation ATPase